MSLKALSQLLQLYQQQDYHSSFPVASFYPQAAPQYPCFITGQATRVSLIFKKKKKKKKRKRKEMLGIVGKGEKGQ